MRELIGGASGHCRDSSPAAAEVSGLTPLCSDTTRCISWPLRDPRFRSSFCQQATFNSFGHLVSAPHAAITVRVSKGTFAALARGSPPRDRIVFKLPSGQDAWPPHRPQHSPQTLRLTLRCVRLLCCMCVWESLYVCACVRLFPHHHNCWEKSEIVGLLWTAGPSFR